MVLTAISILSGPVGILATFPCPFDDVAWPGAWTWLVLTWLLKTVITPAVQSVLQVVVGSEISIVDTTLTEWVTAVPDVASTRLVA